MGVHCERDESSEAGVVRADKTYAYTINDIVRTFGISRTTIMYYESLGIVTPRREGDQTRRVYSDADVYRLMSAMLFKNAGVAPKDLAGVLDGQSLAAGRFDDCARRIERELAYKQAVLERLRLYARVCCEVGHVGVRDVEPYYFVPDCADAGYRHFPEDGNLDLLIANMPLGGLGSRLSTGSDGLHAERWGRTVPVRYAGLIEGLDSSGFATVGGCTCVWSVAAMEDIRKPRERDASQSQVQALMEREGLVPAGECFSPFSLPSEHGFIVPTCVPVEPAGA